MCVQLYCQFHPDTFLFSDTTSASSCRFEEIKIGAEAVLKEQKKELQTFNRVVCMLGKHLYFLNDWFFLRDYVFSREKTKIIKSFKISANIFQNFAVPNADMKLL